MILVEIDAQTYLRELDTFSYILLSIYHIFNFISCFFILGEVMLVTLAPLTNVAMALRMDPDFGNKLKQTIIMGGNIQGTYTLIIFKRHFK